MEQGSETNPQAENPDLSTQPKPEVENEEEKKENNAEDSQSSTSQNEGEIEGKPPSDLKSSKLLIEKLTSTHPTFNKYPLSEEPTRDKMPSLVDPNAKMSIWSVLKDMVGKDFGKIAVPVWLNEPLSMLQRLCEQLEYSHIIFKATSHKNSGLRMAYVMGFAFSQHCSTIGRHKKPFNPILGETFEYECENFRFISEQVSHHPPVSAGYAEAPEFEWWGDTTIKSSFWGTSFEAMPVTSLHLVLKEWDDHYIYKRPITSLMNIIVGTSYIENYGEMPFRNAKTGDTGKLIMKKRGWGDKGIYETEGWIKNAEGKTTFKLEGKWDSYLKATNVETNEERMVWERIKVPEKYEEQYSFTYFTKQLNHLYKGLLPKLIATDCRFRTDQRAYEHGNLEMAKAEKSRLEEKQRTRRKEMKDKGEVHKPRWFQEIIDPETKEKSYKYVGGYWDFKEKEEFPDTLDLF